MPHALAILGPIPPPHGGIAVHLERLLPHLDEAGVDFRVYNTAGETAVPDRIVSVASGKRSWFVRYLLTSREPVVYILNVKWQAALGTWVLSRLRGVKVVLSLQGVNPWFELSQSRPRLHRWIAAAFESAERVVVASDPLCEYLSGLGDFAGKIEVIPAFIPPLSRSGDEDRVSEEIREFCADHDPVLSRGLGHEELRAFVPSPCVDRADLVVKATVPVRVQEDQRLRQQHGQGGIARLVVVSQLDHELLPERPRARHPAQLNGIDPRFLGRADSSHHRCDRERQKGSSCGSVH